jgi:hypothetical protein
MKKSTTRILNSNRRFFYLIYQLDFVTPGNKP